MSTKPPGDEPAEDETKETDNSKLGGEEAPDVESETSAGGDSSASGDEDASGEPGGEDEVSAEEPSAADDAKEDDDESDELGDVVDTDDEDQPAVRVPLKQRLIAFWTPARLCVALVVVAVLGLGWWATRPIETPKPPPEPPKPEELYAEQIQRVLDGVSKQLHTVSYPIKDEDLKKLPFDQLKDAAKQRSELRQHLESLAEESGGESPDDHDENSAPLPPSDRFSRLGGDEPQITELPMLETVLIDEGVITDKGMETIAEIPELRHVRLRLSPITDAGLEPLLKCETLWFLNLPHSKLTEEGVRSLSKLPKLRQLRLGSTLLGNEVCRALLEVKSLRGIHLIGVPVSDEGLKVLVELPHLESLYLDDSGITETGWDWLFQNHPQLHVHINQRHHDRDPQYHVHE
ncbi:adenylate cyclase [Rhodopirellula halodulae]|uniref:adenylate cyclase n=1 Tax=Rhodopirellula halodulae TaxID=2894198 RepID=UPI001E372821|nr:adenylate cyclase [Rhodopirellula sp. JC737]MCC9658155.1 adenylate cyclase [Rhodopirellula sp. JC737]